MVVVKTSRKNTIAKFHSLHKALEFAQKKIFQRAKNGWMYKVLFVYGDKKVFVVTRDGIIEGGVHNG